MGARRAACLTAGGSLKMVRRSVLFQPIEPTNQSLQDMGFYLTKAAAASTSVNNFRRGCLNSSSKSLNRVTTQLYLRMKNTNEILYMPVQDSNNECLSLKRVRKENTMPFNFRSLLLLEGIHLILILGGYVLFMASKYGAVDRNASSEVQGLDTCK